MLTKPFYRLYLPLRSTRLLLQGTRQTSDNCSLRDSTTRKGWAISHRDSAGFWKSGLGRWPCRDATCFEARYQPVESRLFATQGRFTRGSCKYWEHGPDHYPPRMDITCLEASTAHVGAARSPADDPWLQWGSVGAALRCEEAGADKAFLSVVPASSQHKAAPTRNASDER